MYRKPNQNQNQRKGRDFMKFNFMGYDVEIKAKQPLLASRNNERDTKQLSTR